jgi:hypothetical protein
MTHFNMSPYLPTVEQGDTWVTRWGLRGGGVRDGQFL